MKEPLLSFLGHYPLIGGLVSIAQLLFGKFAGSFVIVMYNSGGINPVIKDLFQIGAWTGAILVALVTIIASLKTHTRLFDKVKFFKHESHNKKNTK